MKLKNTFLTLLTLGSSLLTICNAQQFWIENWTGTTCNKGCFSYTGPNGTWTIDSVSANNGTYSNAWYFSYQEQGMGRSVCGSATGTNASAHVGNVAGSPASLLCPAGDCGASYDASNSPTVVTNKTLTSPVINCSGKNNITLSFNYIMAGEAGHDNDSVEYFDGISWSFLAAPPLTVNTGCLGQGKWTYFSVALPATANNNPAVQLGFKWINDGNGRGKDPSFAVDSIILSSTSSGSPPVAGIGASPDTICPGDSIYFTDLSTNSPTGRTWTFGGGNPASSSFANQWVTYSSSGSYITRLVVSNVNGTDSAFDTVLVQTKGTSTIHSSKDTICPQDTAVIVVSGGTSYLWNTGKTTSSVKVYPVSTTTYSVLVNVTCGIDTLTKTIFVQPCLEGVQTIKDYNNSEILPNPNNGNFTIQWSVFSGQSSVEVYNVLGEKVYQSVLSADKINQINLNHVPAGVYLYRIISEDNIIQSVGKFVVK